MVNHECYRIKNQIVLWYHKTEPVTHFQLIRSIRSGRAHLLYMHCCVVLEPGYAYLGGPPSPSTTAMSLTKKQPKLSWGTQRGCLLLVQVLQQRPLAKTN